MRTHGNRKTPKKDSFHIGLDPMVRNKAEKIADKEGISLAEVFRRAVLAYPLQTEG